MTQRNKAFWLLFATQLFESLSYFGLRALIVLYLVTVLHWSDAQAYLIFGAFISLICIAPILGGHLADRWLGQKNAIMLGGLWVLIGHLTMTFAGTQQLFLGLSAIILGSGLMLPSLCVLVGKLYPDDAKAHDRAYYWYYMAVNLGGIVAGLLVGSVAYRFGWHIGFGVAAVGMLVALVLISSGWSLIEGSLVEGTLLEGRMSFWQGAGFCVLTVGLINLSLQHIWSVRYLVAIASLYCLLVLGRLFREANRETRSNLLILISVFAVSLGYFILYEQSGTSITLFTERVINRHWLGMTIPTPVLTAINPLFVILLAPLMASFWLRMAKHRLEPSIISKVCWGIVIASLAFIVLALVGQQAQPHLLWFMVVILLLTCAELCVGPVSLAAISNLAPPKHTNTIMGIWFITGSIASYLSAQLARLTNITDTSTQKQVYIDVFHWVGVDGLILGLSLLSVMGLLRMARAKART